MIVDYPKMQKPLTYGQTGNFFHHQDKGILLNIHLYLFQASTNDI